MTRINDDDIAAEDGPSIGAPRTREEWDQVFRALDEADKLPSPAVLPDFSTMGEADRAYWFDANATKKLEAGLRRRFAATRDLPAALDEGRLTRAEWGTMNVGHPIVVAALAFAEKSERWNRDHGLPYRCDGCLSAESLETFPWAGALFVHLLTCQHFAAAVNGDA